MLPVDLTFEEFSSCDYLPQLQQLLFSTDELDESVTYESFVVVPETIKTTLHQLFGEDVDINGPFVSVMLQGCLPPPCPYETDSQFLLCVHFKLLDHFGHLSLRRFVTFFVDLFSIRARRRRLEQVQYQSPAMMRGALMRAIRDPDHASRKLQCGAPLLMIELNEYITLTFDFNFGEGKKG